MMSKSTPSDVVRIVGWDELPPSVRDIPADHNPLKDGLLMKHQADLIKLCETEDLVVVPKGRRTGITYAFGLDSPITAATNKIAGGDNVYYIGDTKEKGLEFIGYCAHMAKVMATAMADGWDGIEVVLFEDQDPVTKKTRQITAYRIRFASGHEIVALSSNPANIRGLQGIVIIDEAAFHGDVAAVIEACLALIIWGGKIRIVSTHNGVKSAFNQLVKDARLGLNQFKVFEVYFDGAVENGLFERVCYMKGKTPTAEGKKEWYNKVRNSYGTNRAAMLEELDGVPRDGNGVAIPGILVEASMREIRPVLRLALDDEFSAKSNAYKESWVNDWIEINLKPLLEQLNPRLQHVFGQDFARHGDFSVIAPMSIEQDLTRRVPFIVEMKNVPTRQQEQILWYLIKRLPNWRAGWMDASGNGETLAEYTADKFGRSLVEEVKLSDAWYREHMVKFQRAFEDKILDIPRDADVSNDIRSLQLIDGIIKLTKLKLKDTKNAAFRRHGDSAIAIALAYIATLHMSALIEFTAAPDKASRWDVNPDDDDDISSNIGGAW